MWTNENCSQAFGIKFDFPQLQKIDKNKINKSEIITELQKIDYNHGKKMIIVVLYKRFYIFSNRLSFSIYASWWKSKRCKKEAIFKLL